MQQPHFSVGCPTRRGQTGSQIAEFGAALVVLATVIIIPLVDLLIVPVRLMMVQDKANLLARRLALCETFSASCADMLSVPSISTDLNGINGVRVESADMCLRISQVGPCSEVFTVYCPGQIPSAWLPDGINAPCLYSLELRIKMLISPAFLLRQCGYAFPGLTAPFPVVITASHEWQNLGRDPLTGEYFLNE